MEYAVVSPSPGISENTTLPLDAKQACSEFELGVEAFALIQEEFNFGSALGSKIVVSAI